MGQAIFDGLFRSVARARVRAFAIPGPGACATVAHRWRSGRRPATQRGALGAARVVTYFQRSTVPTLCRPSDHGAVYAQAEHAGRFPRVGDSTGSKPNRPLLISGCALFVFAGACLVLDQAPALTGTVLALAVACVVLSVFGHRVTRFRAGPLAMDLTAEANEPQGAPLGLKDDVKQHVARERSEVPEETAVPLDTLRDELDLPALERADADETVTSPREQNDPNNPSGK